MATVLVFGQLAAMGVDARQLSPIVLAFGGVYLAWYYFAMPAVGGPPKADTGVVGMTESGVGAQSLLRRSTSSPPQLESEQRTITHKNSSGASSASLVSPTFSRIQTRYDAINDCLTSSEVVMCMCASLG
jgi:hypothetical protein